ncbi:MAG: hypothetical protein H8E94_06485 [Alphaproteobacteria bacterium]|nr:hypothetical protein [Alphaproteobacteria bacterium]
MGQIPTSDEIRRMVREALRSVAPNASAVSPAPGIDIAAQIRADLQRQGTSSIPVQLTGDFDLNLFIGRILSLADAGDIRNAMASGKVRFTMEDIGAAPASSITAPPASTGAYVFDKGVLNETKIAEIAKTHTRAEIGRAAVITPLARDRARELKIELIRRRP